MVGAPLGWGYPVPLIIKLTQKHLKNQVGIYWVYHPLLKGSNGGGSTARGPSTILGNFRSVYRIAFSPIFCPFDSVSTVEPLKHLNYVLKKIEYIYIYI